MKIEEILCSWEKSIPIGDNTYFWDSLFNIYPRNCYIIDQYPMVVKDNDKFKQLEIFHAAVSSGEISIDIYKKEEDKLKNIMRKLWAYNLVEVETNLIEKCNSYILKAMDANRLDLVNELRNKVASDKITIDNVEYLDVLVELGARERVYSCFVFHNFKVIAVTNALDMPIFIADLRMKDLIEKIVTVEGLYLRPCIEEQRNMGID